MYMLYKNIFFPVSVLFFLVLILSSCSKAPTEPLLSKILVVDFDVSEDTASVPREIKGWWFGARDVYRNPNSGEIFSDIFAKRLNEEISCVDVYSRMDYRYYKANKIDRLKNAWPDLDDETVNSIFAELPPQDFARDLQQDKVLIGKLNECYTTHNRTIHWWSSVVDLEAILLDAETGQPEWTAHVRMRKSFLSQNSTMEKAVKKLIKQIKKNYFYKKK
jgi:hypothetical protein